ncbi:MAG: DUF1566 domain-containing protein [Woeseiaceae bacterium]
MKKIAMVFLIFISESVLADTQSDSDILFNWAETQYPQFFSPANQSSKTWGVWYYRYYPDTNNYLGTNTTDFDVYIQGDSFEGLTRVDTLNALIDTAGLSTSATKKLNDTGIISCGNESLSCPQENYPGQDAEYGRDILFNDSSDGHAGFSFTKLDSNGNELPSSASTWSCVKDNITTLIWEIKTNDDGLQDKDWYYTWYNSTGVNDGSSSGTSNEGVCFDSNNCDTEKYIQQVNNQHLCGMDGWRLPTKKELVGIVSFDRSDPMIDSNYFPNTIIHGYWSSTPHVGNSQYAWVVGFGNALSFYHGHYKSGGQSVRLVNDTK